MQETIINIMNEFGYIGIFLLVTIENIFPPIPSEIILTFGGFMVGSTNMTFAGVVIASTLGSVVGAIILYYIGTKLKLETLEKIADSKFGKLIGFRKEDIHKSMVWFREKGAITVLFTRCMPGFRSLISIPAGTAKMKFSSFLIYTTIGTLIWNILLIYLGYIFGSNWETVNGTIDNISGIASKLLIFTTLISIIILVVRKRKLEPVKITKDNRNK